MNGHGSRISQRQEQAIAALLSEASAEQAALKIGVPYRTLKRWMADTTFKASYAAARQGILERTVAKLLSACEQAVSTLEANLTAGKPGEKTRAAVAILDRAVKGVECLDLISRLEALEQQAKERQPQSARRRGRTWD
jgi:transposase